MTVGKVRNFSFPSKHGFTGSAGGPKVRVKAHLRTKSMPGTIRQLMPYNGGVGKASSPPLTNPSLGSIGSEVMAGFKKGGRAR